MDERTEAASDVSHWLTLKSPNSIPTTMMKNMQTADIKSARMYATILNHHGKVNENFFATFGFLSST